MSSKPRLFLRSLAGLSVMAALLFISSGDLHYWHGWVFLAVNALLLLASLLLLKEDPGLVTERLRPGRGMKWWDKGYYMFATPLYFAAVVVAGLDVGRFHWSDPPGPPAYALGWVLFLAGQGLFLWAKKINPFFSSVVRLQTDRGQAVCRAGPYTVCRHPGYLGGLLFGLATPLVLGSAWAFIPQGLAAGLLILRTALEDRMLKRDLLWYAEYAAAVRSRLVPGIW